MNELTPSTALSRFELELPREKRKQARPAVGRVDGNKDFLDKVIVVGLVATVSVVEGVMAASKFVRGKVSRYRVNARGSERFNI